MPHLLVELGTEEIPAAYLEPALAAWRESLQAALAEARVEVGEIVVDGTPRRLVLFARDLAATARDLEEEVQGPPAAEPFLTADGLPTDKLRGFLRSNGLGESEFRIAEVEVGKGKKKKRERRVVVTRREAGRPSAELLPGLLREQIAHIPFPKRMRWNRRLDEARLLEFARPLRYVVALLDEQPLPLALGGVPVGRASVGHAFLTKPVGPYAGAANTLGGARGAVWEVPRADWAAYVEALATRHDVVLPIAERQQRIRDAIEAQCAALGVRVAAADRERLVPEVANLVEFPGLIVGRFEAGFLELPAEVLRASMIGHQRYFPLEDAGGHAVPAKKSKAGKTKKKAAANTSRNASASNGAAELPPDPHGSRELAGKGAGGMVNAFLAVIDRKADPNGTIRDGNERVLRARLSDARFFWDEDRKRPLSDYAAHLAGLTVHQSLGSFADKTARLVKLAQVLATADQDEALTAAEHAHVARAAALCKADLVTQMVFEFPELQGIMGGHYARAHGEPAAVADAIAEHYRPAGRDDALPTTPLGAALATLDKADALAGYFLIGADEKKGGDPLGLRRLSIGLIRLLEAQPDFPFTLSMLFYEAALNYTHYRARRKGAKPGEDPWVDATFSDADRMAAHARFVAYATERLRAYLRDEGYAHDHIEAVLAAGEGPGRLADLRRRLDAVSELSGTAGWDALLELAERTGNLGKFFPAPQAVAEASEAHFEQPEERELYAAWQATQPAVAEALAAGAYVTAAEAYRDGLAAATHRFFERVLVLRDEKKGEEVPEPQRSNRLALLRDIYRLLAEPFAALDRIPRG